MTKILLADGSEFVLNSEDDILAAYKKQVEFVGGQKGRPLSTQEKYDLLEPIRREYGLRPHQADKPYVLAGKTYDLKNPPTTLDLLPAAVVEVTKERINQAGDLVGGAFDLIPLKFKIIGGVALAVVGLFGAAYIKRSFK